MNELSVKREGATLIPGLQEPGAPNAGAPRDENDPILVRYLKIALRRRWYILGAVGAALVLGLIATLLMTPLYSASVTLEISRESSRVVDIEGVEAETNPGELEFYQTQYGLLRSRSLAERVARDLKLADNPAFFEMFGRPQEESGLFASKGQARMSAEERNRRIRAAGEILLANLEVSPVRLSRLVEVTFTSPDPYTSARVANAWAEHFIESNLERRFEATSYARKFLEERLEQLRKRLEDSERLLVAYASNQKIINIPTGADSSGATVERSLVADDLASLNGALNRATADVIAARSKVETQGANTEEALNNEAIVALRQKRAELAAEYARLLVQFEPEYPKARALATEIEQLDRSIAREEARVSASLQGEYRAAQDRAGELQARVDSLKAGLLDQRRRSIQYNIYQREVDTNRQLYDGLLQRYKEIGIAGGVGTNNIAVVDPAMLPRQPSKPNLLLNLFLSLIAGLTLGLAAAFALEQLDEAISDPQEVEKALGLPVLGTVPKLVDVSPVEALGDRKSPMVEAYLSVQTNLEFATDHGVPRSLSITSTRPSEGKSTTAYAVAQSLARAKRKVVLVDGDMRSPSVHHLLGFANERGLSNFLAGSDDLAALLRPGNLDGLSIMTAGPQPPNAAELLTGERLERLLASLLETFDHVIIDSPPVMGLADGPLIGSRVEGVIFAVESHGIKVSMVRVALGRLRSANANVLGTVLTKFESKRAHFGYGYDYGYSYGETAKA